MIPISEQTVRLRLPEGRNPSRVHLLVAGSTPQTTLEAGWLEARIPSILDREVLAVDF